MTFDPSLLPPGYRLFTEGGITYGDSDDPPIATARRGFDVPLATMWVRSHGEPMMMRDGDGHWMLFYFDANNSVVFTKFHGATDIRQAATKIREWLDKQGLLQPDDLQGR